MPLRYAGVDVHKGRLVRIITPGGRWSRTHGMTTGDLQPAAAWLTGRQVVDTTMGQTQASPYARWLESKPLGAAPVGYRNVAMSPEPCPRSRRRAEVRAEPLLAPRRKPSGGSSVHPVVNWVYRQRPLPVPFALRRSIAERGRDA